MNHQDWMVDRQKQIQGEVQYMHQLLEGHREALSDNETDRSLFGLLVGVGYSLWHAVQLLDATREWSAILADAQAILKAMVEDPVIDYERNKKAREWSGGYYLNSARYRLKRACEKIERDVFFSPLLTDPALAAFRSVAKPGAIDETDPKAVWDALNGALAVLLHEFDRRYPRGHGDA